MKNIYFVILSVTIILYILYSIRKGQLSVKASFCWMLAALVMLILSIFPYSIDWLAEQLNVSYGPTLLLTISVVFLIILDFNFSKKIAKQQEKIIDLAQEVSLLKEECKNNKE